LRKNTKSFEPSVLVAFKISSIVALDPELRSCSTIAGSRSVFLIDIEIPQFAHHARPLLDAGQVRQFGSPLELYHMPQNQFVAGFIGSPKMNFLSATVTAVAKDGVTIDGKGFKLFKVPVSPERLKKGDPVQLGIRPEHVLLTHKNPNCKGEITLVELLGHQSFIEADIGSERPLTALVDGVMSFEIGEKIGLSFEAKNCHLFDASGEVSPRLHPPSIAGKKRQR
jgi:multiple sugar transport system ATP-binding protein